MRFIDAVRVFLGFWLAALIFTFPILVGWLFPIQKRRLIFYTPWLLFSKGVCLIFRIKLDVEGLENLKPGFEKNHLFICNHQSALDIPLLVSQYPIPFLTKKQNLIIPFLGLAGVLAGSIAFDRDKMGERRRVLREIVERVKEHTSLYIFPEGTRSRNGEIQERIYPALLRIAWKSGIDVIPIALHGSYLVIGHKPPEGHSGLYPVSIRIGTRIEAKDFENDKVFADHCWQQVIALHSSLTSRNLVASDLANMVKN